MSKTIRRLAACLLLVLLPLQAFAGVVAASEKTEKTVNPCPQQMQGAQCCDKAKPAPDQLKCCAGAACAPAPSMSALLPNAVKPLPKIFRTVAIDPPRVGFDSSIPDSLQRPARALA